MRLKLRRTWPGWWLVVIWYRRRFRIDTSTTIHLSVSGLTKPIFAHQSVVLVPDASGGGGGDQKKQNYTKPRIDDFVYEVDGIANTLGQIVAPPAAGMMKTLISKGQNALEQSDGTFSTFTFKGWKVRIPSSIFKFWIKIWFRLKQKRFFAAAKLARTICWQSPVIIYGCWWHRWTRHLQWI